MQLVDREDEVLQAVPGPRQDPVAQCLQLDGPLLVEGRSGRQNDQQVDVAAGPGLATRERTEHRGMDRQRIQGRHRVRQAGQDGDTCATGAEDGIGQDMVAVEPVQVAAVGRLSADQAVFDESVEDQRVALTRASPGQPGDLCRAEARLRAGEDFQDGRVQAGDEGPQRGGQVHALIVQA